MIHWCNSPWAIFNGQQMDTMLEKVSWFAMRVTYRRELKVKEVLDSEGIENYVPVHQTIRLRRSRRVKETVPVVRGIVFVHATLSEIQRVKTPLPYFQYMTNRRTGEKIIVPDDQMRLFIAVTSMGNENLLYFGGDELNLAKGTRVRVTGGDFEGYEGIFLKVKGARDRRVVISIEGVIAVALATISPEFIEVIPDHSGGEC